MSAINREDAIKALLSKLAEREEPAPAWLYSTITKCLNDLPSLPSTEPLVHDGLYLCDKKLGACPSWERKGWTKCMSKHCNRTSRVDHALKLPDANEGWIPVEERLPEENGEYLVTRESVFYRYIDIVRKSNCNGDLPMASDIKAWMPLPKPYEPKEDN